MKRLIAATSLAVMSMTYSAQAVTLDLFTGFAGFGDSLSDKGRNTDFGEPFFGGRFSSGPTWMEIVGAEFELRGLNHFNLALGGATAGDTNNFDPDYALRDLFTPIDPSDPDDIPFVELGTFDRQITSFVTAGFDALVGDNPLVGLLFGGNDFLQNLGVDPTFDPTSVAQDIADGIGRLADLDPKFDDFLVLNLPDASQAPVSAGLSDFEKLLSRGATELFNASLVTELAAVAADKGISIEIFDLFSANDALLVELAAQGVDVTTPCASVGACKTIIETEDFFFIDGVHPTGIVQARISEAVLPLVEARLAPAPVPLPAGMPLLIAGVAAFGALRIARKRAA